MHSEDPIGVAVGEGWAPPAPPLGSGAHDLGNVTLASRLELPEDARAAVFGWLDGRVPSSVVGDAQLLVSELVTNSYRHAGEASGAPVRIRAGSVNSSIWLEGDGGRDGAVAPRAPMADGGGGFGLNLVHILASHWGVTHVDGTEVWFVLALPGHHEA